MVVVSNLSERSHRRLVSLLHSHRTSTAESLAALTAEAIDAFSHRDLSDLFDESPTVDLDPETLLSLQERTERRLSEIDEALTRVADGTYGLCVECHEPIPFRRLEALPAASRCIECSGRFSG